jgi:hypothetical protein
LANTTSHIFDLSAHTRTHFNPQHWLLCHMGLYKFEFEFADTRIFSGECRTDEGG